MSAEAITPLAPTVTQMTIDGRLVDAVSGKTFATIDPRSGSTICQIAEGDAADINLAVAAARKAFDHGPWPRMSGRARGILLNKFADILEANASVLANLETLDNGKPHFFSAAADVPLAISHIRYFAGWADKIHGETLQVGTDFGSFQACTFREPIGVVGQIIPWNFPLLMMAWKIAPALATGNTVVIKIAEQTPLTGLLVGKLAVDAGIPAGVLNVVTGFGHTAGATLAAHMDVDKIAFTGSTEVGHKIMIAAGMSNLKRVSLELGGKSAAIVCADADIDKAVADTHFGLFFNMGQCCCACSRIMVHESVYDEFVEKAVAAAKKRTVGNPFAAVDQGPQISEEQFDKILGYIEQGKAAGAELLTGGSREGTEGYFIQPTVFGNVQDDMIIAKEEIFGPVMSILKFSTNEEAVRRANASDYGLAAGVFSRNIDTCNTMARNLRCGTVWINCYDNFDDAVPFGGYKKSGNGRDKGMYALEHYTEVKCVQTPIYNSNWL